MRRYILYFAAIAAVALCACTRENAPEAAGLKEVTLTAYSGDVETKSSRGADGTFYWSPGDQISLFRGKGDKGGWKLTSTSEEPSTSAEFKGDIPVEVLEDPDGGMYWGVYPYSEANSFDGEFLTTVVPSDQSAAEGTFADGQFVSIGVSDNLSMGFYHLCGGIKFTLKQSDVTEVRIKGNAGETLAGKVIVSLDGDEHPVAIGVIDAATEVSLTCKEGFKPGVEYFIVTLPVELKKGFTVDFGNGRSRTVETSMTINRAKFQWSRFPLDDNGEFTYEECDVEDSRVREFLERVDYSSDIDYSYSAVGSQFNSRASYLPVTIKWEGTAASVEMSSSSSFDTDVTVFSASGSSAKIYNLIPGVPYYFKVKAENGVVIKRVCVTPVGPLRAIKGVARKNNVRDLGGWEVDGGHIAYGKLYRGARLDEIQSDQSAKETLLNTLGVSVDLDLRGLPEGTQGGSAEYNPWTPDDPIEYCNIKLWHYFVPSANANSGPEVSEGVTSEQYQYAIRRIIDWISQDKVVYFHCHGGSDRTGTLAFLIEALLGVSESDLSKDYELTCFYGESWRRRNGASGWFFAPMVRYLRTFDPDGTINDQVRNWAMTRHSDTIDPLTDKEIEQLRNYLIVKD